MDYRNREYYLVKLDELHHNRMILTLQRAIPYIKIHKPYNHFKTGYNNIKTEYDNNDKYDGEVTAKFGEGGYYQMMIGCNKEWSDILEMILNKEKYTYYLKLDKNKLGQ